MILYREKGKVPLEHYFTNNENLKSELRKLIYNYEDVSFEFFSDNGVFAKNKIDYASKLLVETFIENHKEVEKEFIKSLEDGSFYKFAEECFYIKW